MSTTPISKSASEAASRIIIDHDGRQLENIKDLDDDIYDEIKETWSSIIQSAIDTARQKDAEMIEELKIQLQEIQASVYAPGVWLCPKCSFTQFKSILYVKSGSIASDLSQHKEPCPNDGAEMQRVTWKERATDVASVCEQQIQRAVKAEEQIASLTKQVEELTAKLNSITPLKNSDIRLVRDLTMQVQELKAENKRLACALGQFAITSPTHPHH
jgi:archaellum component FlaC